MKLWYSFLKDLNLAFKGFYIYIELGFALIFVAIMVFVVPENSARRVTVFTYMNLPPAIEAVARDALRQDDLSVTFLPSRADVEAALAADRTSLGLSVSQENGRIVYDYILQGYESDKFRNVIKTSIESGFAEQMPGFVDAVTVTTMDANNEKLTDRIAVLPVYLALNAAFMGLFIIAAYVFLDKDEGTIRAVAVTPAKVWHYLAGKMGVMLVAGLMSGLITTVLVAGAKPHYLHLVILLIACNAFGSALGLFIASFFDTMVKAMGWLYASVIVLGVAGVSYYMPAFSPLIIRILPSYPMLFAFRETLLDASNTGYIYLNVLGFSAAAVVFFLLANWRFKRTLTV